MIVHITESSYLSACARIRGIPLEVLVQRLIGFIDRDNMVVAVLDDASASFSGVVRAPTHERKKYQRTTSNMTKRERGLLVLDMLAKKESITLYDLEPSGEYQKWFPALEQLISDGQVIKLPRSLKQRQVYQLRPQVSETVGDGMSSCPQDIPSFLPAKPDVDKEVNA